MFQNRDMFENENEYHKKLIFTLYYQLKVDIFCCNKQFQPFLKNVWGSFVQLVLDLNIYALKKDNFTNLAQISSVRNGPNVSF